MSHTKKQHQLLSIAKRYKPRGVFVHFRRDGYLTPAHAIIHYDGSKVMYVPKPESIHALYIFLHECAHHHLGHCKSDYNEPLWRMEYEAEQWTIATMRREGLSVSRSMLASAKEYVAECAIIDIAKGRCGPPAKIKTWMSRKFKTKPKPIENMRRPKIARKRKKK